MTMGAGSNGQTSYYVASNWDKPIGLARDGHLIVGPYKDASGTRWDCSNRDVCNGAFIGSQYVYVGSETFPYVLGCWGPGPNPNYVPTCTNNGCGSTAGTSSVVSAGTSDSSSSSSSSSTSSSTTGSSTGDAVVSTLTGALEIGIAGVGIASTILF